MSIRELIYFFAASALGLFTFVFFLFSRNSRLKQRLWTAVNVLGGALFIAFMLGRDLTGIGTFFAVFCTLGFVYLSLSNSRFCEDCSALIFGPERPEWRGNCPSCDVRLPWSEFYPKSSAPPSSGANGVHPKSSESASDQAESENSGETRSDRPVENRGNPSAVSEESEPGKKDPDESVGT